MASTQKTIMIIFFINLIIGSAMVWEEMLAKGSTQSIEPTYYIDNEIVQYEDYFQEFDDDDQNEPTQTRDDLIESTYGSTTGWGSIFWDIITDGVNPFSTSLREMTTETYTEKIFSHGLSIFRVILLTLISIEGIMVLKNRKTS